VRERREGKSVESSEKDIEERGDGWKRTCLTHVLDEKLKPPAVTKTELGMHVKVARDEPGEVDSREVGGSGEVGERSDGLEDLGRDGASKGNVDVEGRSRDGSRQDLFGREMVIRVRRRVSRRRSEARRRRGRMGGKGEGREERSSSPSTTASFLHGRPPLPDLRLSPTPKLSPLPPL